MPFPKGVTKVAVVFNFIFFYMKIIFLWVGLLFFQCSVQAAPLQTPFKISGKVYALSTKAPVSDIRVELYDHKGHYLAKMQKTDGAGKFLFRGLEANTYFVKAYPDVGTIQTRRIDLTQGDATVSIGIKIPVAIPSGRSVDSIITFDPTAAVSSPNRGLSRREAADNGYEYISIYDPETFEETVVRVGKDGSYVKLSEEETLAYLYEEAGQLTAGVVSDHNNWETWTKDVQVILRTYADQWSLYPTHRYWVQVVNKQRIPIPNQTVRLKDKAGTLHWEARTDNTGRAELWYGLNSEVTTIPTDLLLEVEEGSFSQMVSQPLVYEDGSNTVVVSTPCSSSKEVDIVWVVDATGSMKDEIEYLQAELKDVISRAESSWSDLKFKQAAVFYKSEGDDYVTQKVDFSPKIEVLQTFIEGQVANGGQSPEAVEQGLDVAINELQWRNDALAKILFLVLDEPPHISPVINRQLYDLLRQAAQKGIRIIPIAASGTREDTEYLCRAMALATNGHYVFLTDDSGIGNAHAEPTASAYQVEYLNNLLVRLIDQATLPPFCEENIVEQLREKVSPPKAMAGALTVFPNPATDQAQVIIPAGVSEVLVTDANGRFIERWEGLRPSRGQWDLSAYAIGVYYLHYVQKGVQKTERLVVINP